MSISTKNIKFLRDTIQRYQDAMKELSNDDEQKRIVLSLGCCHSSLLNKGQHPVDLILSVKELFWKLRIKVNAKYYRRLNEQITVRDMTKKIRERADRIAKRRDYSVPGVYVFLLDDDTCDRCLKVGRVGNIDCSRWHYQHYHMGSANSTVLGAIAESPDSFAQLLSKRTENQENEKELLKKAKEYKKLKDDFLKFAGSIIKRAYEKLMHNIRGIKNDGEYINNLLQMLIEHGIIDDEKKEKKEVTKIKKLCAGGEIAECLKCTDNLVEKTYEALLNGGVKDKNYVNRILNNLDKIIEDEEKETKQKEVEEINRLYEEVKKEGEKWLPHNTCRLEFIFDRGKTEKSKSNYAENFLEGYLHWLLQPCYEGKVDDDNESTSDSSNEEGEN